MEGAAAAAAAALTSFFGGQDADEGEDVVEETARKAAAVASSFFSGASMFLSGVGEAEDGDGATDGDSTPARDSAVPRDRNALGALLDLNPLNSLASGWIDDLERDNSLADPLGPLRQHLDAHLADWPAATYEEWVEEALVLDGWDRGSAVVDDTFYAEGSAHRNVWNERMAADDADAGVGGEGEGGEGSGKRYVRARKGLPAGRTGGENAAFLASKARTVAAAAASPALSPAPSGGADKGADKDTDLSMLIEGKGGEDQTAAPPVPTAARALKEDEDDDLAELLGDEEEGEVVFVSK